mgnify:CR=1 FL=1
MEERDLAKEELETKRKEVWDLKQQLENNKEDQTSIHASICPPDTRRKSIDGSEKACQR